MRYLIFLSLLFSFSVASQPTREVPKSPRMAIVIGQQMVDAGELEEAIPYLENASKLYPDNDTVWALYGQSLYEAREIEKAENAFRQALVINPLNKVAKTFVEDIRETSAASVSLEYQKLQDIALDKVGDIVVLALGFLLASATGGTLAKLSAKRFVSKTRRHFMVGQYEDFADLLEIQLSTNALKPLRESLEFMLQHKSLDQSVSILENHVNNEENLNTLIRMIKLAAGKNNYANT